MGNQKLRFFYLASNCLVRRVFHKWASYRYAKLEVWYKAGGDKEITWELTDKGWDCSGPSFSVAGAVLRKLAEESFVLGWQRRVQQQWQWRLVRRWLDRGGSSSVERRRSHSLVVGAQPGQRRSRQQEQPGRHHEPSLLCLRCPLLINPPCQWCVIITSRSGRYIKAGGVLSGTKVKQWYCLIQKAKPMKTWTVFYCHFSCTFLLGGDSWRCGKRKCISGIEKILWLDLLNRITRTASKLNANGSLEGGVASTYRRFQSPRSWHMPRFFGGFHRVPTKVTPPSPQWFFPQM